MTRKVLCKLLAVPVCVLLILLLCAAPAVADSVDLEMDYFDDDDPVVPYDDIAFSEWTSTTSLPTTAGNYKLMNDVSIDSRWKVPTDETNLDLNGHTIRFSGERGQTVGVLQGCTLNLYDSVGTGTIISTMTKQTSENSSTVGAGVYIYGGTFTMYGGTILGNPNGQSRGVYVNYGGYFTLVDGTIKNNINIAGSGINLTGCGVYVYNSTFTQIGGLITGNTGYSGVGVDVNHGTFIMRGGAITNNTASQEGGGVRVWNSSFIMYDGIIADNTAAENGGGVELSFKGNGELLGGIITNNTARQGGGVRSLSKCILTLSGCNITGNRATYYGGGVRCQDTFIMLSGNITNNTADYYGGGVSSGGNFTMYGGKITNNTGLYGSGGVDVGLRDNFVMSGGEISGNTAGHFGGGGVNINGGNFTMNGGIITGNKATERPNNGGGVLVDLSIINADTNFILSGGIIDGNFAMESYNNKMYVPNNVLVDDPRLEYDLKVTIADGGLKEGTKVGISTSPLSTLETPVAFTDPSDADYSRYFFADNDEQTVIDVDGILYLAIQDEEEDEDPVDPTTHEHDGIMFTPWTKTTSLPKNAGNYYLTKDVTIRSTWSVPDGTTNLCLNGHVIKQAESARVISLNGEGNEFNIYDCGVNLHYFDKDINGTWILNDTNIMSPYNVTGGVITGGNSVSHGAGIHVNDDTVFSIHGGNIVGNTVTNGGGGVFANHDATSVTMYGGNIVGNTANYNGGAIYACNNFTLVDGTIAYNIAGICGGGLYACRDFTMLGGNIINNIAEYGGGVDVYYALNTNVFNMSGGLIAGNVARVGGGVHTTGGTTFIMSGGSINGNSADGLGSALHASSTVKITGNAFIDADNDVHIGYYGNIIHIIGSEFTGYILNITVPRYIDDDETIIKIADDSSISISDVLNRIGFVDAIRVLVVSDDNKEIRVSTIPEERYHMVNVTTNGNGYAYSIGYNIKYGTTVTLMAYPDPGYALKEWRVLSGDVEVIDNKFVMKNTDVNIEAIFLPEYQVPIEDTTKSVNAATAAEVGYRVNPINIQEIKAPSITRGGKTLVLNETVVVKVTKNGNEEMIEATVNTDGTVNVADADLVGVDSISITFIGRKIGDTIGNGRVDVSSNIKIARVLAGLAKMTEVDKFYGDINADGKLKVDDNIMLARHLAGILDENFEVI